MVCTTGPVLLDFGLAEAWVAGVSRESLDARIDLAGTAFYVAPVVIQGDLADPRTDLYALGVMLFEACTGTRPFEGDVQSLMRQHLHASAPDPRERNAELSPEVAGLVRQLLAKDPVDRPASARQVARRLAAAVGLPPAGDDGPPARLRSRLVGRDFDLEGVEAVMQHSVVVLSGEAGAGKTRMLMALASRSRRNKANIWAGEAADSRGALGGVLGPLRPALRQLVARAAEDPVGLKDAGPHVRALEHFDPELRRVGEASGLPTAPALEGDAARERAIEAARAALVWLARDGGAIWLIDDVHLVDELTLGLLEHRSRFPQAWPGINVVCALRSEDRTPAATRLLGFPGVTEVPLDNLDEPALSSLLAATLGTRSPPQGLVDEVLHHAGGNPCFAGELLFDAVADGRLAWTSGGWQHQGSRSAPPVGIRAAADRRVAQLDQGRGLLRLAATLGPAIDARVLAGDQAGLTELLSRRVLVLGGDGLARFAHAALHAAARDTISPTEAASLHRAAAEAIEAAVPEPAPWRDRALGAHWRAAGENARAWGYLVASAERARAEFAFGDAERLYQDALAVGQDAGSYAGAPDLEAEHRLALGTLRVSAGDFAGGRPEVENALALSGVDAGASHWMSLLGAVARLLARRLLGRGRPRLDAVAARQAAFAARGHTTRTWIGLQGTEPAYLLDAVTRALAVNDDRGDEASPEPYANAALMLSMMGLSRPAARYFAAAERQLAQAPVPDQLRACFMRGLTELFGAHFVAGGDTNLRGANIARDAGERVLEGSFLHQSAQCALYRGRSDEALALALRQSPAQRAGIGRRFLVLTESFVHVARGDAGRAGTDLEAQLEATEAAGGGAALVTLLATLAQAQLALGDAEAARNTLHRCTLACDTVPARGPSRHAWHLRRPWLLLQLDPGEAHDAALEAVRYFRRLPMGMAVALAALAAAEAQRGQQHKALAAVDRCFRVADEQDAGLGGRLAAGVCLSLPGLPQRVATDARRRIDGALAHGPLPHWLPGLT